MKKVAIIGGGVVGLAAAKKLADAGYRTTLFTYGKGASSVAPGVNSIKGLFKGNSPLFRLKISGHHQLWKELTELEQSSQSCLDLRRSILEPFKSQGEFAKLAERAYHGRFWGLFGIQVIPRQESLAGLHSDFQGALCYPDDFSFDTEKTLDALLQVYLKKGGEQFVKQVSSMETRDDSFVLHTACGSQYSFEEVIFATGASTPFLLKASGMPLDGFTLKAGVGLQAKSNLMTSVKRGQTSLNANGKQLKFGAKDFRVSSYVDKEDFEEKYHQEIETGFRKLLDDLKDLSPIFSDAFPLAGVRLNGPGRSPFVGRYSNEERRGPLIAAGFHKSAWSLAWSAADILLDLIEKS
ncbi:MAG: FAD-dependent oxidoreductase [Pseudomonadota bacterium]